MLTFATDLGPAKAYVAGPASGGGLGLLAGTVHAWWGLNPFFKSLCDRLALAGFVALAPDLNEGQVAATIDEAQKIQAGLDRARVEAVALGAIDALRSQPGVQPGGLGALRCASQWEQGGRPICPPGGHVRRPPSCCSMAL